MVFLDLRTNGAKNQALKQLLITHHLGKIRIYPIFLGEKIKLQRYYLIFASARFRNSERKSFPLIVFGKDFSNEIALGYI